MTQPPNIREVDCCANCVLSFFDCELEYDMEAYEMICKIHQIVDCNNICDDFKREE